MTTTSSRQPKGVPVGGQFATQARTESEVSLAAGPAGFSPPSEAESVARLTERDAGDWLHRSGAEAAAQDLIDRACAAAGPDVPREWVAAVVEADRRLAERGGNSRSPIGGWSIDSPESGMFLREAYATGMPADWPDQMAARGETWQYACVKRWTQGLTADELDRLDGAGYANGPRQAMSLAGCDIDDLDRWNAVLRADPDFSRYAARYLDLPGVGAYVRDGVPLEDVRLCQELGVEPGLARHGLTRPDGTTETGPEAIRELAAYAKACGQSTDEAHEGIRLAVPAADVKAHGPKVAVSEIRDLQTAGVPAKVARSLRGRDGSLPTATITQLNAAGITTGADYKSWTAITQRESDPVAQACALSRAGVPIETATRLHGQRIPTAAIPALRAGGIDNWSTWAPGIEPRTQVSDNSQDHTRAFTRIGDFARLGGTREQFARAQKAGVPLADLGAHVHATPEQLWSAGAANRDEVMAAEHRRHEQWGPGYAGTPEPWPVAGPAGL
jgi:hypothetical protein